MDPKDRVNDQRLTEFLSEFQNLQDEENKNFFHNFCNNADLQQSIYRVLQRPREESLDILKDLCQFLLKMYRSAFGQRQSRTNFIPTSTANDMLRTRVVVLQYLPHFIYLHLIVRSQVKQRSLFKFIDAFLLSIYNSEVMEQQSYRATASSITNMPNNPLVRPLAVKVPPLSTNSCYHDSARLESEDKLDQRPSGLMFHFESWAFVETLNASSKPTVFRVLLQIFNRHIVEVSKYGLDQFVRATLKVLDCGYGLQTHPRIHLDTSVSQELLFSAYVCMYNGFQVIYEIFPSEARRSGAEA